MTEHRGLDLLDAETLAQVGERLTSTRSALHVSTNPRAGPRSWCSGGPAGAVVRA